VTDDTQPNTSAEILRPFAGERRKFALKVKQIDELQRLCGAGIGEIVARLHNGNFYVRDVYDTIRLGLIGGGDVDEIKAFSLCETYIDGSPLARAKAGDNHYRLAKEIIGAVFFGLEELKAAATEETDDPNKKKDENLVAPAG